MTNKSVRSAAIWYISSDQKQLSMSQHDGMICIFEMKEQIAINLVRVDCPVSEKFRKH